MIDKNVEFGAWYGKLRAVMALPTQSRWLCKCDCDTFAIVTSSSLLSGNRRDCGCDGGAKPLERIVPKDRLGNLTLVSFTGRLDEQGDTLWLLKCDCEAFAELPLRSLNSEHTQRNCCGQKRIKSRRLNLTGRTFPLFKVISFTDKNLRGSPLWLCECQCGRFFEASTEKIKAGRIHSCGCHRAALMTPDSPVSWFQEGTYLHSFATKRSKRNTSGVTGVRYLSKRNTFEARLIFKGKLVLCKTYKTFAEAVEARKEAEDKYVKPLLEKYGLKPK